jgi:hypothetical protein
MSDMTLSNDQNQFPLIDLHDLQDVEVSPHVALPSGKTNFEGYVLSHITAAFKHCFVLIKQAFSYSKNTTLINRKIDKLNEGELSFKEGLDNQERKAILNFVTGNTPNEPKANQTVFIEYMKVLEKRYPGIESDGQRTHHQFRYDPKASFTDSSLSSNAVKVIAVPTDNHFMVVIAEKNPNRMIFFDPQASDPSKRTHYKDDDKKEVKTQDFLEKMKSSLFPGQDGKDVEIEYIHERVQQDYHSCASLCMVFVDEYLHQRNDTNLDESNRELKPKEMVSNFCSRESNKNTLVEEDHRDLSAGGIRQYSLKTSSHHMAQEFFRALSGLKKPKENTIEAARNYLAKAVYHHNLTDQPIQEHGSGGWNDEGGDDF